MTPFLISNAQSYHLVYSTTGFAIQHALTRSQGTAKSQPEHDFQSHIFQREDSCRNSLSRTSTFESRGPSSSQASFAQSWEPRQAPCWQRRVSLQEVAQIATASDENVWRRSWITCRSWRSKTWCSQSVWSSTTWPNARLVVWNRREWTSNFASWVEVERDRKTPPGHEDIQRCLQRLDWSRNGMQAGGFRCTRLSLADVLLDRCWTVQWTLGIAHSKLQSCWGATAPEKKERLGKSNGSGAGEVCQQDCDPFEQHWSACA